MRRRFRSQMVAVVAVVAVVAAVAAAVAADATDVWFMQHLVPHLRQTISVADPSCDRITRPELARLAPHSHQAVDRQPRSDLERLSRVPDARFDRTFGAMLAARRRAGDRLAAIELRQGSLPEVRELARRLQAEHRRQLRQLTAWRASWSRTPRRPGPT